MVRTHLQLIINGFEKPTVLFMNYINFFLLWPQWASERNHNVIRMYAIFLGIRRIYICFQSYSRLHFQAFIWKPGRKLIIVCKSAAGQSDLSLLQLFLTFHSSIHVYPNIPIPITHYFPGKIWKQRGTSSYLNSITLYLLLLFLWCHWWFDSRCWSCNSIIASYHSSSYTQITHLPGSHPVILKQFQPHILHLLAWSTVAPQAMLLDHWTSWDARWGQEVVHVCLETTGFQMEKANETLNFWFFSFFPSRK